MDGIDAAMLKLGPKLFSIQSNSQFTAYTPQDTALLQSALGRTSHAGAAQCVTKAHVEAVQRWLIAGYPRPDVIGFHGQTIFHDPAQGMSVQIGDPQALADELNIPVVADLRQNDVQHGGQGAPLVPIYHQARLGSVAHPTVIVNIGGVSNITYVDSSGRLLAFDTGPGNAPIDDWIRQHTTQSYDLDGAVAAAGQVHWGRIEDFLKHPFFQAAPPKSLDRDAFDLAKVVNGLSCEDGAATLTALTARSIAAAGTWLPLAPKHWYVTGGGRRNATLLRMVSKAVGHMVSPVEDLGWNGDMLEAEAFAYLAWLSLNDKPMTFPTTTGVKTPLSGGVLYLPTDQ